METSKNDKLIQKLRCASLSVVYQALVDVRTKEVNSANGVALLRKRGALKYFVRLLQKPNEKIIDVTLSILGNCCMENESRVELWHLGVVGPIVRILDSIGKDSIQGRTCRVLANLSQHPEIASAVCREGAVPVLVNILKPSDDKNGNSIEPNNASDMTKQMSVRALRVLGESSECRGEIVNQSGVRAIAELVLSSNEALQKAAIKALATLTQHCSDECALQVQGDGACFEHLVSLVGDPVGADEATIQSSSLSQSALTCLANLARVPGMRPKLGNAGAINAVINQLRNFTNLDFNDEWKQRDLVSTLCLFCRESVNRMKLRDLGGLSQLVIHLKVDRHGPVAAALCNFGYDDSGFRQLVDNGLIHICAERLRDLLSSKRKGKGRSHAFVPKNNSSEEVHKRRNSSQVSGSSPSCRSRYRQASVDDACQISPSALELKGGCSSEEFSKKVSKSPMKTPQKTFRISSPSYQAVCSEQEGRNPLSWSPPPVTHAASVSVNGSDWNGSNSSTTIDCSSLGGSPAWPGVIGPFSFGGYFHNQNPASPVSLAFLNHQLQEEPLSPEASSCSGGSSSSCTSGYASSPRSELSDSPSPGCSSSAVNVGGEVYSPVYEDLSDDSGQEDHDEDAKDGKRGKGHVNNPTSNKRARNEDGGKNQESSEGKTKKKCSSPSQEQTSTTGLPFRRASATNSVSVDDANKPPPDVEDEDGRRDGLQGNLEEESVKCKHENSLVDYLLILLSFASQLEEPIEDLASRTTFSALLDYHIVNRDPLSRASRILSRIVSNEHYLIPLINQSFVLTVRSWFCSPPIHEEALTRENPNNSPVRKGYVNMWEKCSECHRLRSYGTSLLIDLSKSAESGYGEGELAYGLLKGDRSHRTSIALSLPFIIRSKKILSKLLFGCNGFVALLDVLKDYAKIANDHDEMSRTEGTAREDNEEGKSEDYDEEGEEDAKILNAAIDGLSHLAESFCMATVKNNPLGSMRKNFIPVEPEEEAAVAQIIVAKKQSSPNDGHDKVNFSLDDGSSVITSREGLSSISPVFRAMLRGDFMESNEGISVKLPGVSHFSLRHILHHLGECQNIECIGGGAGVSHPSGRRSCRWAKKPKEVYTALELVSIADRFLLPDMFCKKLADQVLDLYLCPESAASIYLWCLGTEGISGSRAPEDLGLLEGTVKYILVGSMTLKERVSLIKSVFGRGYGEELLSHVNDLFRIYFE